MRHQSVWIFRSVEKIPPHERGYPYARCRCPRGNSSELYRFRLCASECHCQSNAVRWIIPKLFLSRFRFIRLIFAGIIAQYIRAVQPVGNASPRVFVLSPSPSLRHKKTPSPCGNHGKGYAEQNVQHQFTATAQEKSTLLPYWLLLVCSVWIGSAAGAGFLKRAESHAKTP